MDVHAHLRKNYWFSRQTNDLQSAMLRELRLTRLHTGQTAYLHGDENTGLWLVLDGAIRLEMPIGADRDVLIAIVPAGGMFGRTRAGGANARIVSARATAPTTAAVLSDGAMERIGAGNADMWRALIGAQNVQVEALLASIGTLLLPPINRVAARLRQFAVHHRFAMRQSDLAELCGLTRKSVSAHLGRLQAAGIIALCYGAIEICDMARLIAVEEG